MTDKTKEQPTRSARDTAQEHHNAHEHLRAISRGEPVSVREQFVRILLQRYPLRSASRRGFVIVVADWLVRLADDAVGRWTAQLLPQSPDVARGLWHVHEVRVVRLADGWDVLECASCGMEW